MNDMTCAEDQICQQYDFYVNNFKAMKVKVNERLYGLKMSTNGEQPIDLEIKEFIYSINELSFVYTYMSCAGHFNKRENIIKENSSSKLPPEGYGHYINGEVTLIFAPEETSHKFISELNSIVKKYDAAKIVVQDIRKTFGENESLQGLIFKLELDTANSFRRFISVEEGLHRRENVCMLIGEMYSLSCKTEYKNM